MQRRCKKIGQLLMVFGVWACGKTATPPALQPAPPQAPQGGVPVPAALPIDATSAAAVPLPPPPTVTDAEVRGLLQQWLTAQNTGDFATYNRLYADKMTGIRKSGHVARTFGRAGWMADRKRMFGKVMVVAADQLTVAIAAGVAQVQFVQSFNSGNFADTGPKRLTIIADKRGPLIAREEMLHSQTRDALAPEPPPTDMLALAIHAGGKPWLVLGQHAGHPANKALLLQSEGPAAALKLVDWSAQTKAWQQRDVVLYGRGGELCRGQVQALGAIARVVPHFATVQDWHGVDTGRAVKDSEIAAQIWDLGQEDAVIAVQIRAYQGECAGVLWGRASNLPPPDQLSRDATKAGALRESALEAMRKAAAFLAIQKDYTAEVEAPRALTWDQHEHAVAQVTSLEGHGIRIVVTRATAGPGCGGFYGEMTAVWTATAGPAEFFTLQMASDPRAAGLVLPEVAADVDGDGVFELIAPGQIWRRAGAVWRPALTLVVPNFDCPC